VATNEPGQLVVAFESVEVHCEGAPVGVGRQQSGRDESHEGLSAERRQPGGGHASSVSVKGMWVVTYWVVEWSVVPPAEVRPLVETSMSPESLGLSMEQR
jgi:hypothetical protein